MDHIPITLRTQTYFVVSHTEWSNTQVFNGSMTKLCPDLNSGQQRFTDLGLQETFMLESQIKWCNEVKGLPQHNNTSSNL